MTFAEEGIKGFYRGYFAYMFAICFWAAALPSTSDFMLKVIPYIQNLRNRKSREELIMEEQQRAMLRAGKYDHNKMGELPQMIFCFKQ